MIALACWGLPLILIGAIPVAGLALAALFVVGVSNAVLDITGFTLVQRGVRNEDRVAMFGVMEGLFGIGLLLGSLAAPAARRPRRSENGLRRRRRDPSAARAPDLAIRSSAEGALPLPPRSTSPSSGATRSSCRCR